MALIRANGLNEYDVWNSFILSYGPSGYMAIPSGLGVAHKTFSMVS